MIRKRLQNVTRTQLASFPLLVIWFEVVKRRKMVRGLLGKLASRYLSVAGKWQQQQLRRLNIHEYQIELYNNVVQKEGTDAEEEAKKAYIAAREESDLAAEASAAGDKVYSALINRVDVMLQKLEKEIDDVDAKIGVRWRLLDRMLL